jgi:plastocyanin
VSIGTILIAAVAMAFPGAVAAGRGTGIVTGTVTWTGPTPDRRPIDRSTDPVCAGIKRNGEDVVVEAGKLRDVHVRLKNGSAGRHTPPAAPAVVVQSECMYGPRVVGIVAGQTVEIRNADPTFHNVRGNLGRKILWNLGQPATQPPITRTNLGSAGDVVSLHCDVHPWMAGWIAITDHPYFAVTASDGAFALKNVPVGSHTLEAWHPTLGVKTAQVSVRPGKTAKATFAFADSSTPPAAATGGAAPLPQLPVTPK